MAPSIEEYAVTMTTTASGSRRRTSRSTSRPGRSGSIRSSRTTSWGSASNMATASAAEAAAVTS